MKKYILFVKKFFKENKGYIYMSFIFLFLAILLFLFLPIDETMKQIMIEQTKQYMLAHLSKNQFILAWNIFLNNVIVSLFILISGFLMSVFWILILFGNVMIMWIILPLAIEKVWILKALLAILPHWITEIFAVLLSLALALKITTIVFKKVWNWKQNKLIPYLKEIFIFYLIFVIPLFLLSAIIEAFITPLFL